MLHLSESNDSLRNKSIGSSIQIKYNLKIFNVIPIINIRVHINKFLNA